MRRSIWPPRQRATARARVLFRRRSSRPGAIVRRVDGDGWLSFRNLPIKLGRAFTHRRVALQPTDQDGCFDLLFCAHRVGALDLREAAP